MSEVPGRGYLSPFDQVKGIACGVELSETSKPFPYADDRIDCVGFHRVEFEQTAV